MLIYERDKENLSAHRLYVSGEADLPHKAVRIGVIACNAHDVITPFKNERGVSLC